MKSFWNAVIDTIYSTNDYMTNKVFVENHIKESKINPAMKNKMLFDMGQLKTNMDIWRYVTNSKLRFEGMGVA